MSRNAISANPEHYIFKLFWGSMPPDPLRRPKNIFSCRPPAVCKAEEQQMTTAYEDISKPVKSPSLNSTEDENEQRQNGRAVMRTGINVPKSPY